VADELTIGTHAGFRIAFCHEQPPGSVPQTALIALLGGLAHATEVAAAVRRNAPDAVNTDELILTARVGEHEYHVHAIRIGAVETRH